VRDSGAVFAAMRQFPLAIQRHDSALAFLDDSPGLGRNGHDLILQGYDVSVKAGNPCLPFHRHMA
ncbi:hypothetical protein SB719_21665, partial [Pantoea sp. SIMBA_079]|uniref:hypothetical protein n=1 Tax=Pantoea sp. SIMBA_079 TaxID=3085817 RepID=UPI0039949B56